MNEDRPRGEKCQQTDCGAIWPPGTLTPVEVTDGAAKRKVKMCPKCVDALVRRADLAAGGRCGMCARYQPTVVSQEGDPLGHCGFHGVPVAADDEKCDTPGAYKAIRRR